MIVHNYRRIRSLALLVGHCKRIQGINCIRMLTWIVKFPVVLSSIKITHIKEVEIIIFLL
jgi:hypothetical protein